MRLVFSSAEEFEKKKSKEKGRCSIRSRLQSKGEEGARPLLPRAEEEGKDFLAKKKEGGKPS